MLRRSVISACIAVGSFAGVASVAPTAHAASWGSVWTVASASYDCGSHVVTVIPSVSVNGQGSVYAFAQVYDYNRGGWVNGSRNWVQVTPYSPFYIGGITNAYAYARVSYTRYANGVWSPVQADWVYIAPDPATGVFCSFSF
jgi:hypothetical protein